MSRRDHRVRIKSREDIARIALAWWQLADRIGFRFDICIFVTTVLTTKIREKGPLNIEFCTYEEVPEGACVSFNPLTLSIVRQIWDDAKIGKSYARFIIAHEIGHIILHDELAVAFSSDDEARPAYLANEESAESQANAFADLFLVPDHVAIKLNDADTIEGLCVVTKDVAVRRLTDAKAAKHPLTLPYEGEMCWKCGNFTLVRNGPRMKCDTCGSTTG